MEKHNIDWSTIWPGFNNLLTAFNNGLPKNTDTLTNAFILVILGLAVVFFIIYLSCFIYYLIKIGRIKSALNRFASNPESFNRNRHEIESKFPVFKAFISTLTEYDGKFYANQDVETFFNGKTLASNILHSKFLPFAAIALTGLGVLGTFLGLQLGLNGLQLDGDMQKMQSEIRQIAQGASVAFATSVWGVFSSIVLNLIGHFFSAITRIAVTSLQSLLLKLFPYFPVMDIFKGIHEENKKSSDNLGVLSEQIGNEMQKSLDSFLKNMMENMAGNIDSAVKMMTSSIGSTIKSVITETLVPSIDKMSDVSVNLANRQASNSQETMTNLLNEFMGKMGQEGDSQRVAMQSATNELRQTISHFGSSMDAFLVSLKMQQQDSNKGQQESMKEVNVLFLRMLEQQNTTMEKVNKELFHVLNSFETNMKNEQSRQSDALSQVSKDVQISLKAMSGTMENFFQQLEQHQLRLSDSQDNRHQVLERQMQHLFEQQKTSLEQMDGIIAEHVNATQNLLQQGGSLQENIRQDNMALAELVKKIEQSGESMVEASDNLKSFSATIQATITRNAESVEKSINIAENLTLKNKEIANQFKTTLDALEKLRTSLGSTAVDLDSSMEKTRNNFDSLAKHYTQLSSVLREHMKEIKEQSAEQIKKLDKHLADLLTSYSKQVDAQVKARMNSWDKETQSFCQSMQGVVATMATIVDEIEQKQSRTR